MYRPSFIRIPSALEYVKFGAAFTGYTVPPTVYGGSVFDAVAVAAAGIAARCRRAPLSCRFTVAVDVVITFALPRLPPAPPPTELSYRRNIFITDDDDDPPLVALAPSHVVIDVDTPVARRSAIARAPSRTILRVAPRRIIIIDDVRRRRRRGVTRAWQQRAMDATTTTTRRARARGRGPGPVATGDGGGGPPTHESSSSSSSYSRIVERHIRAFRVGSNHGAVGDVTTPARARPREGACFRRGRARRADGDGAAA